MADQSTMRWKYVSRTHPLTPTLLGDEEKSLITPAPVLPFNQATFVQLMEQAGVDHWIAERGVYKRLAKFGFMQNMCCRIRNSKLVAATGPNRSMCSSERLDSKSVISNLASGRGVRPGWKGSGPDATLA